MNLQLHFAQKIIKKYLKLAEIDLFHSNAKIGFFWQKTPKIVWISNPDIFASFKVLSMIFCAKES